MLVAIALLPAIAIQGYNEFDRRRARQLEVQDHALSLAKLAAADQQQIVQGIRQVLIALSELPSIKSRDSAGCTAYLSAIKQRFPAFITVIVTDLKGLSFCHTDGKQVDVSKRAYFNRALATGAFTVGEYSIGLSSDQKVMQFALPFYDENRSMGGVIIASLGLDWLGDYVARKASGWSALAVTDRNGTYLARYPDNDRFVGTKMPGFGHLTMDGRDAADVVDVDGIERIQSYAALEDGSGGLVISFGLDKARAFAEIQRETLRDTLLILLSTTLVLALASLGARQFIHRPLGQLVDAANQWRLGEFSRRVDISANWEIALVADAFNTMADALECREQELSKAKDVAEEAAARITTIFESTNDSVLIVDRDRRIRYLNGPAWASIAEGHDIIGKTLFEAFQDDRQIEVLRQIEERTSEQQAAFFEVYCPRRSIWYAINAFPSSQGFAIFLRDITEHKHALEARRQMEEQLHQSQKMESVGQLTGGVAHDFNNLLTVVSGNLELVETATDVCRVRKFAAAAQRAIDRGTKLTAQLLAFSRRQTLNPKVFNAGQRISEFQDLVRQAVGAGYEIELRADDQLWPCYVDPSLLETALLNLVLNARDAMPDGGVLQIETRNIIVEEGALAGCSAGPFVKLSVTDTGCGMPPEVQDRVFEPFFTTKEVGKGTGLGLSMVYGFVRQSGGHVTIESAPGEGTTISLYLPKAAQEPEVEEDARQAQLMTSGSERILLVDDNKDILEVTSEMLSICGYRVSCARSGAEALRMLQSDQEFELLLTDIVMPSGMSGVELARDARRLRRGIKILLTSGYARDMLQRHNAVDEFPIIRKPFRLVELARSIQAVLQCTKSAYADR
ncbi:ATP-binding protein [Bradyrhizobium elkanii]|uniref:ATP-binding protein n=1 Tax=Bradyrhizobium elkanii TaxID=29448 RepID=UPI001FD9E186|nr:ATP-binding protein [Bradyrhizobium elkanii]